MSPPVHPRSVEGDGLTRRPVGDIPPPPRSVPRYSRTARFPEYRYVPGVHPHPVRDPSGHSYAPREPAAVVSRWRSCDWRSLEDWLWGVDLFNAFFFWEAHEAWETLWRARKRSHVPAIFLQGLIQIAAALIQVHIRSVAAATRLAEQGTTKLDRVAVERPHLLGLHVAHTRDSFRQYFGPLEQRILPPLDASVPALLLRGVA